MPLGEGAENNFIRPYISIEGVKERLKGPAELGIYKYESDLQMIGTLGISPDTQDGTPIPVQTYLITYPVFDMELNFDQYINGLSPDTSRVPPVSISRQALEELEMKWVYSWVVSYGEDLPFEYWVDPFEYNPLVINLGDMKDLVKNICFNNGVSFSIKAGTREKAEELQRALRIRAPRLKIGNNDNDEDAWVRGDVENEDGEFVLKFKNTDTISETEPLLLTGKSGSDKIIIEVRLVNRIEAGNYESEFDFNWHSAEIEFNIPKGTFTGLNLGSYLKELGSGSRYETAPAYLYLKAPPSLGDGFKNGLTVGINGASLIDDLGIKSLVKLGKIRDKTGTVPALSAWLNDDNQLDNVYDLADVLSGDQKILHYTMSQSNPLTIINDEKSKTGKITAMLAVLLPMSFKFTGAGISINYTDPETSQVTNSKFFPLKFQGLDDFLGDSNDNGDKSVLEQIDEELGEGSGIRSISLELSGIKNTVARNLFLGIAKYPNPEGDPDGWHLIPISGEDQDYHPVPLVGADSLGTLPPIKFLVMEEGKGGNGRLYIRSHIEEDSVAFGVKISVLADIDLDKSLDL
jgi:hypothetical protein